jgi:choice-of-anchor B domain-containing protein
MALSLLVWTPAGAQSSSFGNSVVIDGDEMLVAEPNNNFRPGTVYVYRRSGSEWRPAAELRAPDAERADGFGAVLAVAGNTLFVAQRGGRLHTFQKSGGAWSHTGTLEGAGIAGLDPNCNAYGYCGTDFGLALAASGDWLLVGEPGPASGGGRGRGSDAEQEPPPTGVVHVFQRSGGSWTPRGQLRPEGSAAGDRFGAAVVLSGERALIGAPNLSAGNPPAPQRGRGGPPADQAEVEAIAGAGRVFDFRLEDGSWREVAPLPSRAEPNAAFGASLALDGDVAVIGAPGHSEGHGAAYLYHFEPEAAVWNETARLAPFTSQRGDQFGSAVGVTGGDVWVGAPTRGGLEMGAVYVYRGEDGQPAPASSRRIELEDTNHEDLFGGRVAAAGSVAAVSALGLDHGAGGVAVFERDGQGAWRQSARLVSAPDALPVITGEALPCAGAGQVDLYDCQDVDLLSFVSSSMLRAPGKSRGVRTNDNWGWTDPETGREFALVGRNDGTSFIDITDPANPVLVGDLPKTPNTPRSQLWRDIKTYRNHAFIVADGAGQHGMQIFDLTRLRDVQDAPALFEEDVLYRGTASNVVASSHNIAINEETGFAYLVGGGCGGIHMVDITEPQSPRFAGCTDPGGTHDMQCLNYRGPDEAYQGREICLRSAADDFIISDVTDKDAPRQLAAVTHPNPAYLHQGWVTEDHAYFIMDDESDVIRGTVPTTRTLIWDIRDLEDPRLASEFMGSLPASAHNLYIKDGHAYQANYRYGLHVLDVTDPENPREVGTFDTSPYQTGPGFSGAWSTYPFFDSGSVIVTSLQEGLFVLKPRVPIVF